MAASTGGSLLPPVMGSAAFIMADYTGNHIGAVEMIVATAICGILYALFSGQPMIVLGGTGPLLIFTMILYNLCVRFQVDFLAARSGRLCFC